MGKMNFFFSLSFMSIILFLLVFSLTRRASSCKVELFLLLLSISIFIRCSRLFARNLQLFCAFPYCYCTSFNVTWISSTRPCSSYGVASLIWEMERSVQNSSEFLECAIKLAKLNEFAKIAFEQCTANIFFTSKMIWTLRIRLNRWLWFVCGILRIFHPV